MTVLAGRSRSVIGAKVAAIGERLALRIPRLRGPRMTDLHGSTMRLEGVERRGFVPPQRL
jgi:hypothetical protein